MRHVESGIQYQNPGLWLRVSGGPVRPRFRGRTLEGLMECINGFCRSSSAQVRN